MLTCMVGALYDDKNFFFFNKVEFPSTLTLEALTTLRNEDVSQS